MGENTAGVLLYILGIAFPPALVFITLAQVTLPLLASVAPFIISAVQNGISPFKAAESAHPGLGTQIATLAARIPVNIALSASISHLDYVTMLLVTKSTKGFAVPGWNDQETQQWLDHAAPPSNSQTGSG